MNISDNKNNNYFIVFPKITFPIIGLLFTCIFIILLIVFLSKITYITKYSSKIYSSELTQNSEYIKACFLIPSNSLSLMNSESINCQIYYNQSEEMLNHSFNIVSKSSYSNTSTKITILVPKYLVEEKPINFLDHCNINVSVESTLLKYLISNIFKK